MKPKSSSLVAMLLIIFLICSPLLILPVESSYTLKSYPTHDSWIEAEYPGYNHGYETSLRVKSDSRTRRSYLKFDLSSIPNGKTITSVRLYLYCTYADANPNVETYAYTTADNWSEGNITWNNAPAVGSMITHIPVGGTGQYYYWDITSYGQTQYSGDKVLSVVVKLLLDDPTQNNPNLARYFASKETYNTSQDPYLEVMYENAPPTASFTYSPTYPVANDSVAFDASASYDPDGTITTYSWDFGDGNVTAVSTPIIEHVYAMYDNYTVTLTVTDNDGLNDSDSQVVEVVDPAILQVSLPAGTYVKQNTGNKWIDEGWLLNQTGNTWSFTVKIEDTSKCLSSYDTHLIVALNSTAYSNLQSLTINGVPITGFKDGTPKPYNTKYWPNGCVYPTRFNDTYIVGKINPKSYLTVTVSVTFSNAANAAIHFDAYGSIFNHAPYSWSDVTWSPHSEDSTVLYQAAPSPLSVSISPTSAVIDYGQYVTFTSYVSGGTLPYTFQWYRNGTAVAGATSNGWTFTPSSVGFYLVHLNVTDNTGTVAKSNVANVTVNPALSVSIDPTSSVIILGESVDFTSTVTGGTSPFAYQWYVDDNEVSGANSSSWTFTPATTGYYLVSLKVNDGASAVALSDDADVTVNPRTYTLKIMTTTGGTTNPAPSTYTYDEGTNVQVTANPNVNYRLAYWELNGSNVGSDNPITIIMNNNYELTAHFALITYTLTITATTGGTTDPVPDSYIYPSGSYADVTALPSANYFFDHWVLDGSNAGSTNPTSVLMNSDHTLQAVFSLINCTLTITASSGGTTDPAPNTYIYANGSSVQVTAIPDANYKFVKWQLNGGDFGITNPITILMDGNYTLHAVFQQLTYRLTILSSTGGTTNPAPATYIYVNGTYASVTAIPDTYYILDYWLLDGNNVGSANPASVFMIDDHTLQPVFARINYMLTISTTTGGTTNPVPGAYSHPGGTSVDVTATADPGYRFDHWVLDGSNAGSTNPMSILMDNNHDLQAVFAETHTLVIPQSVGGTTDPVPGTYTYDDPTDVIVGAIPDTYYRFDHWVYDGNNLGSENPVTVHVGSSHTLQAVFIRMTYTLTIEATAGGTTSPPPNIYAYEAGSTVLVLATPNINYVFDHWELDGVNVGSTSSYAVFMDASHTLKAFFVYSPPAGPSVTITPTFASVYTGDSVTFTSTVSGGTPPYTYQWYLDGVPVSGATSSTWTFTPLTIGTYLVYLKVTDSGANTAQSSTARVYVKGHSIGGYSLMIAKQAPASYIAAYTALLALFGASLTLVKRKRK